MIFYIFIYNIFESRFFAKCSSETTGQIFMKFNIYFYQDNLFLNTKQGFFTLKLFYYKDILLRSYFYYVILQNTYISLLEYLVLLWIDKVAVIKIYNKFRTSAF